MHIIDISSDLLRAEVYPGDPEPRIHALSRIENDDEFNTTALYACLHSGTHVDAPSHVFDAYEDREFSKTVDELPLEKFIGPVTVVDIPPGPLTGAEERPVEAGFVAAAVGEALEAKELVLKRCDIFRRPAEELKVSLAA